MITIKLYWWMMPVFLFFLPFGIAWLEDKFGEKGSYINIPVWTPLAFLTCWGTAIGIIIGHFT